MYNIKLKYIKIVKCMARAESELFQASVTYAIRPSPKAEIVLFEP